MLLMSESKDFISILKQNQKILLAILMLPIMGMIIALLLITWRLPERIMVAGGVIVFLMVQYLILIWWIAKKMNQFSKS